MLQANFTHILTVSVNQKLIEENENVMICCGQLFVTGEIKKKR